MRIRLAAGLALALLACSKPAPPPVYQALPVERRDIVVSAQASGSVQPDTTVEVKTRASGEVLEILAETGQTVRRGQMIIRIDPRQPQNAVNQARANLDVARAQLEIAQAQFTRSKELLAAQTITQQEFENAQLSYANAKAAVVRAQIEVENNQISLEDTDVRAPITGVIIQRGVERGQVVASATFNAGGGTVLMRMADLNLVQVRTLVDETDIGKVKPGLATTVTVDAYPNRPFRGEVLKIEPLAEVQQNVTMFPVLVRIDNRDGLLRPGMNAEVEIHVGRRDSVLTVPNSALRTQKDVESAATVLGLSMDQVREQLAAAPSGDTAKRQEVLAAQPGDGAPAATGNTMTTPDGRTVKLPEGVTEGQMRAIFAKFRNGEQPTPAERQILQQMRRLNGGGAGGPGGRRGGGAAGATDAQFGGSYIVFVSSPQGPKAVNVRTGLTDLDHAEVVSGLAEGDSVLILPSASLVQSQQEFKNRVRSMTGGGGVPGMQQQQQRPTAGTGGR